MVVPARTPTAPVSGAAAFPTSLFADRNTPAPVQAAITPAWEAQPAPDMVARRERMLAEIGDSRLGTIELKVAFLLQHYPETRESDIALCIRYWERFEAGVLEEWTPLKSVCCTNFSG
jgi:hypothetical protein